MLDAFLKLKEAGRIKDFFVDGGEDGIIFVVAIKKEVDEFTNYHTVLSIIEKYVNDLDEEEDVKRIEGNDSITYIFIIHKNKLKKERVKDVNLGKDYVDFTVKFACGFRANILFKHKQETEMIDFSPFTKIDYSFILISFKNPNDMYTEEDIEFLRKHAMDIINQITNELFDYPITYGKLIAHLIENNYILETSHSLRKHIEALKENVYSNERRCK